MGQFYKYTPGCCGERKPVNVVQELGSKEVNKRIPSSPVLIACFHLQVLGYRLAPGCISNLRHANFSRNLVSSIDNLSGFPRLQTLDLSGNQVCGVGTLILNDGCLPYLTPPRPATHKSAKDQE